MGKTLYSLMLSDDVVREVDALAHRSGMSRSGLVNRILAEYVSVVTPEQRISDIFRAIESLVSSSQDLVPFFSPNSATMSLKSSLAYKYRPTVKYEVELGSDGDGKLGELSVVFRTQSVSLISDMTEFFRLWVAMENRRLAPVTGNQISCSLYDGRFVRPIFMPRSAGLTSDGIANALSDYIQLFDRLLKGYLSGELSATDIEKAYVNDLKGRSVII